MISNLSEALMMFRRISLAMALIAASCFSIAPRVSAQVSFGAAASYPAGTSPTAVAAGYFNSDLYQDLAVTNQHGVSILLNNGAGGFDAPVTYVAGTNPVAVAAASFDHQHEDLAVVNEGSGNVSIFMGDGTGAFSTGAIYPAGVNPVQVLVADLNLDGNVDLVVVDRGAGPGTGGVSVLIGNGDGTFKTAVFYSTGSAVVSAALGYFNNDAVYDLAVANEGSDNISILLGKSDGTFQTPVNINLDEPGISVSPTGITSGDFDGNGKTDLAVATPNTRDFAILKGKGDGTFGTPVHYALDDPNFVNDNNSITAADINGDNKLDLVLCNLSSNHVTLLFGAGDGTFPTSVSYAAGPQPIGVAIADFNNDQILDVVAADNVVDGEVTVLLGAGGGGLHAPPLYRSGYSPTSLAVGDLDGDGILDIVTGSSVTPAPAGTGTGAVMLGINDSSILGKGSGTFKSPQIWSTSPISAVALGDLNHDGKLDLVETNPNPGNGNLSVRLGKGDGTFQSAVNYTVGTTPETVSVADLNGDGKLDVIVGNRNSTNISLLLGNGDGTLQAAINYSTPAAGTPESIAIGDFNGDGFPDIAVAISGINASEIALFLGNGNGTFQSYLTIPAGFHSSGILRIAAADFDGDGKADIAVTDGNQLSILLGSGNAAFLAPVTYLVGPGAAINGTLAVADFNGDGKPDLVTTSRDGLAIFLNNGDGTFPSAPITYSPFLGGAIAVGDFDGNGVTDIITADSSQDQTPTDTIAVLLNQTTIPAVPLTINTSPMGLSFDVYYGFPPGSGILSEYTTCAAGPCTYSATFGQFFQIYINQPIIAGPAGTQYVLTGFSDDGPTITGSAGEVIHTLDMKSVAFTETINFKTQYQVTLVASPPQGGTVSPAPTFYDSGAEAPIFATANPGYTFTGWTGSETNAAGSVIGLINCAPGACPTIPVEGVTTLTANFAPQNVAVPNVVHDTQAAASTAITGAGLVVGTITHSSSATVPAGEVISESPVAGTQVASGSAVNLVISTGPAVTPQVVSFNVLFGSESYNLAGSSRVHLPWQVTGIRVVFSEPIASGSAASLGGASVTGFSGLGTNTLTWNISPIAIGNVSLVLAGSGANPLKDASGNALNSGANFTQALKILLGDYNDDGAVSAADMVLVNSAISHPYNILADVNGDGVVNATDVTIVRGRAGTSLP